MEILQRFLLQKKVLVAKVCNKKERHTVESISMPFFIPCSPIYSLVCLLMLKPTASSSYMPHITLNSQIMGMNKIEAVSTPSRNPGDPTCLAGKVI